MVAPRLISGRNRKRFSRLVRLSVCVLRVAAPAQLGEERLGELLRGASADESRIAAEEVEAELRKRGAVDIGEFHFEQDLARIAHLQHD